MSSYLEFVTPTQVDLRELFTLGLGSKRNAEGKIGHKGSGMKFTLALLHRLGSHLQVEVGGASYHSVAVDEKIRGADHQLIHLVAVDSVRPTLPCHISAQAGADTWNQPWFALRELLQNCIDEGGDCNEACEGTPAVYPADGTTMRVLLTDELRHAWERKHEWFNPRCENVIYKGTKPGLFYHGFLIFPGDGWHYSYDVTTLIQREQLSEDRQLRNTDLSDLFRQIVVAIPTYPDSLYDDLVSDVMGDDREMLLSATYNCRTKAKGFLLSKLEDAWIAKHGERTAHTQTCEGSQECYYASAAGYKPIRVSWYLAYILRDSKRVPAAEKLLPVLTSRLQPVKPKDLREDALERLRSALKITKRLRPDGCTVELAKERHSSDRVDSGGLAVLGQNKVLLLESFVADATVDQICECLVEEFMHLRSGASDLTQEFQKALVRQIAELVKPRARRAEFAL